MDRKTEYQDFRLSSGASVRVRPRTYKEWEEQEEDRLRMVEGINALADAPAQSLALQRSTLAVRNARLGVWVEQFAKKKNELNLRDIVEIEKYALELEAEEIPLGNSGTGGDGQ